MKKFSAKRGNLLVLAGLGLLMLSGTRHGKLIEIRKTEHLQQVSPEDTTPLVALTTVAFGGFRGLVADALWVRANNMQEEGQYFEMVQLAKWITQLEPRVPEVWSFQSWNLAYNISVLFPEYEDRWRWVSHGLDLLRKQGLTHNPNSTDLHWDIGWMFQHKIGMDYDLAHHLYKRKIREAVEEVLPGGRLTEAALTPERREDLQKSFAMDPGFMLELEKQYGPIDWRLIAAHTLYWSSRGLEYSPGYHNERRLRRMRMQAVGTMMRAGRMIKSADGETMILLPRLELIDRVIAEYEEMIAADMSNDYLELGYSNFLYDTVILKADYGKLEESYVYYEKMAAIDDNFPAGRQNFQRLIQFELTKNPAELSYEAASSRIIALLRQSLNNPDPQQAGELRMMARQLHALYQQSRINEEHSERTGLPPFEEIESLLRTHSFPLKYF